MGRKHILAITGVVMAIGLAAASAANETTHHNYDALGRLVISQSEGTVNDDETRSLCYDAAGNRTKFVSDDAAGVANCAPAFQPMPSPSPISTSNTPPTANTDSVSVRKPSFFQPAETKSVNVIANDTDADGDLPLVLISVSITSGGASVQLESSSNVLVTAASSAGASSANYEVIDARGAVSTGTLTIQTTNF